VEQPQIVFKTGSQPLSASKGKGAGIVATQPSLQPLLPALEVGPPLRVRHDGDGEQA
jgi:hypothetical protein